MGYRSEVAIAIRKGDYEDLLNKIEVEKRQDVKDLIDFGEVKISNSIVVLYWDWVKWYSEFKDVQFIEEFLYELDNNEHSYRFIRIGESFDDVEDIDIIHNDDYECSDVISFVRRVDIDINI